MDDWATVQGMAAAWDRASGEYLARRGDDLQAVTYGALAPDESSLHLLGSLHGRRIIDFGCGGGQNAIVCARAGAEVTGIDISGVQLAYARRLAEDVGVRVRWLRGGGERLAEVGRIDLILAVHALSYIAQVEDVLLACRAALVPDGQLVVAVDHPLRSCFWDEEAADVGPVAVRRYDDVTPIRWQFDAATPMHSYPRTTARWIDAAAQAGLRLARMVEPLAPLDVQDELWPEDSPLAPLREVPHTLIMLFAAA